MSLLERFRMGGGRGATKQYEARIEFGSEEVSVEDEWFDSSLPQEHRQWLTIFGATTYLLKQVYNLGPHGGMLWAALLAGHPLTGESVDDFTLVPAVRSPMDIHFAQIYRSKSGNPYIQTPIEGQRAVGGQLAAVSSLVLLDHVRVESDRQRQRMDAALVALKDLASTGDFVPDDPNTMSLLPLSAMAVLGRQGLFDGAVVPELES